jgi:type I restriction enzyme R subunit
MSSRQYTEKAFEAAIEDHLLAHGYQKGDPETFDRSLALDPGEVIAFIKETQPKDWNYLQSQLGTMAHGSSMTSPRP